MSDQLRLAKLLGQQPSSRVAEVLLDSRSEGREFSDLLDLAGFLLQRKQLIARVEGLHREQIETLLAGGSSESLQEKLLADEIGAFLASIQLVSKLLETSLPRKSDAVEGVEDQLPPQLVAQSIGQSMIALRELILSAERHWLKVMKLGLRKPDAVTFSEYIHFTAEEIQQLFGLATAIGLIEREDERWVASQAGLLWTQLSDQDAWVEIVQRLEGHLSQLQGIQSGESLNEFLKREFPLFSTEGNLVASHGRLFGFSSNGKVNSILQRVLDGQQQAVLSELKLAWPKPTEKIVIQADQTITIAGPIAGSLHLEFSTFADAIDIGLASRFRLTKLSICRGLEAGLTADGIADRLRQLSGADLPQPVSYLLEDAERSLLNIKVGVSGFGSVIDFADRIDSLQLERDRALNPLNLFRTGEQQLASRLKSDIVWLAIRDAGYVAVRVGSDGQLVTWQRNPSTNPIESSDSALLLAERLLLTNTPELDEQNLIKQLQFAQKNRLPVQMSVRLASGSELSFSAIVTGVSETRVRVRDAVADTERTLPLTSILNWELG